MCLEVVPKVVKVVPKALGRFAEGGRDCSEGA